MKKLGLVLAICFCFTNAFAAAKQGVFIGVNQTKGEADNFTVSFDAGSGFEFGYAKHYDFGSAVMLRTGVGYVQKNTSIDAQNFEIELAYIEVPVTAMYSFSDSFAGFAGLNLDLKATDSCDLAGVECNTLVSDFWSPESFVYNLVLGGNISFAEAHGAEVYYEMGMSDIAEDAKLDNSLGLRYLYMW